MKKTAELIERQAAIDAALAYFVEFLGGAFHEDEQKRLVKIFNNLPSAQPTVDAVPVIRCRDCRYSKEWYNDKRLCDMWCETYTGVFSDDYCSRAERKTRWMNF